MFTKNLFTIPAVFLASVFAINMLHAQDEEPGAELSTGQQVEMTVIGSGDIGGPMIFSTSESFGGGGATKRSG
eukprot:COSAG04_NODE_11655_length_696_cov_1.120603_2_plen_72_part_01